MRNTARITLLLLWLFAVAAPSIITLCNVDNPIVVTNLNEEEQQESGKKSMAEEKFVKENLLDFSLIAIYENSIRRNVHSIDCFNLSLEVLSPPPEPFC
ncbi:hypothetical protein [Maribacter sp. ACAM166]|uniref:hypothetical protein n=1 Tax=Maribacter sp. ACAM166 TaxID=2508996 RepID=UPI0010FD344E|nr:hypothetical protein [Maribacter sp. ACAM166]TLP73138.1 hypothetical protein ES765_17570 [Maribacter sp. ACAM166]